MDERFENWKLRIDKSLTTPTTVRVFNEMIETLDQQQKTIEDLSKNLSLLCPIADMPVIESLKVEKLAYIDELKEKEDEIKRLKEALKTIVELTGCDDTWDFANRALEGKEKIELPYRFNQF